MGEPNYNASYTAPGTEYETNLLLTKIRDKKIQEFLNTHDNDFYEKEFFKQNGRIPRDDEFALFKWTVANNAVTGGSKRSKRSKRSRRSKRSKRTRK